MPLRENNMQKNKSLSLSDLIRDPDAVISDISEIPDDSDVDPIKEYGIGIDCHSKFIEVCVCYCNGSQIQKSQAHFPTDWEGLTAGHDWCLEVLGSKAESSRLATCEASPSRNRTCGFGW